MKSIKVGDMKVRDFFRFTSKKILIDLMVSGLLVFFMFFKNPLYRDIFFRESLTRQTIDISVNFIVYMVIFYTPSCYVVSRFYRGEK